MRWTFLIGHRGVGKSALLDRLRLYFEGHPLKAHFFDLDREIEAREGLSISEIFRTQGEAYFRSLEQWTLDHLIKELSPHEGQAFVAVGAGYQGVFPEGVRVIWVRRATDHDGRIFLDRPRLKPEVSAHDEFRQRAFEREPRYLAVADDILELSQGFDRSNSSEQIWFGLKTSKIGGFRTILRWDVRRREELQSWWRQRQSWGLDGLELRDDFLALTEIRELVALFGRENCLLSCRANPSQLLMDPCLKEGPWDWPLELGPPPDGEPTFVSFHGDWQDLQQRLGHWAGRLGQAHLKWSPKVESFAQLQAGHRWWRERPQERSFLPRSSDGRWSWYRQIFGPRMKIGFWREGAGSSADQPPVLEWIRTHHLGPEFAAILGDPVYQSLTPAEQEAFFAERGLAVVAIRLTVEDVKAGALKVLRELGLKAAAVTAPLKEAVVEELDLASHEAIRLRSANTLFWDGPSGHLRGHNTDLEGARALLHPYASMGDRVGVWGGGGTRSTVREILPQAAMVSVRERRVLGDGHGLSTLRPEVLVWGFPRSRMGVAGAAWPPIEWEPHTVVDLSYHDDSPGREYALNTRAHYISGIGMFHEQARWQREFWRACWARES